MAQDPVAGDVSRRNSVTSTSTLPACGPAVRNNENLRYANITDVSRLLRDGELSPVDLTKTMLDRIAAVDGTLKSFATVTAEQALSAARTAEDEIRSGNYRGILHGIPIALKDLCLTNGIRTMGGLASRKDFVPDHDATVVARLNDAGAVPLGKLNLTEGALLSYNSEFDIPLNPWNADYWSGASSSGSGVAVAAGLCFAAIGTDTGGSIRGPSGANGIVGLKPTYGRVSRHGVIPLSETLDHVGPMARSVADVAAVFAAIAGPDAKDATTLHEPLPDIASGLTGDVSGLRIGFDPTFASKGVDPGHAAAISAAVEHLAAMGAQIVEVDLRQDAGEMLQSWLTIAGYEAYRTHAKDFESRPEVFGRPFVEFLAQGRGVSNEAYRTALASRDRLKRQFEAQLARSDANVSPALSNFRVTHEALYGAPGAYEEYLGHVPGTITMPANLAGTPSLTLPCGFSDEGVPHGMQIQGPRLSEAMLCRVGHAYEASTDWKDRHPSV